MSNFSNFPHKFSRDLFNDHSTSASPIKALYGTYHHGNGLRKSLIRHPRVKLLHNVIRIPDIFFFGPFFVNFVGGEWSSPALRKPGEGVIYLSQYF